MIRFNNLFCWLAIAIGLAFSVGGVLVVTIAMLFWLFTGTTNYWGNLWLMRCLPDTFTLWLAAPKEWIGLSKIVLWVFTYLPVGLVLMLPGGLIMVMWALVSLQEPPAAAPAATSRPRT